MDYYLKSKNADIQEDPQWDYFCKLLSKNYLNLSINDVYIQFYNRFKNEFVNSSQSKLNIGYHFTGGETERLFLNYKTEVALLSSTGVYSKFIFNFICFARHYIYFLAKFLIDLKVICSTKYYIVKKTYKKRVVLIRTKAELDYFNSNQILSKNCTPVFIPVRLSSEEITQKSSINLKLIKYFKAIIKYLFSNKSCGESIQINSNVVNIKYLVNELQYRKIMIELYRFELSEIFKNNNIKHIYTFSVTNDEAMLEAELAAINDCKLTHIWRVDVILRSVPKIIPGNRAILMNKYMLDAARQQWPKNKQSFFFKNVFLTGKNINNQKNSQAEKILICTSALYSSENIKFINIITKKFANNIEVYIRLHPRLRIKNINPIIKSYDPTLYYKYIFTWPSSIINEYINSDSSIYVYRPQLKPYDDQDAYYFHINKIKTFNTLEALSNAIDEIQ